jgi:AcrR family transcriptional regulator
MARRAPQLDVETIVAELGAGPAPSEDATTTAILDAAGDLLGRYGVRRWSMEDVAEACGLGRATVYRRFHSRDELVRATLGREARRFFATVASAVDRVDGMEEKVVHGFTIGLQLVRASPISRLIQRDAGAGRSLLQSGALLSAGREALVDRYEAGRGTRLGRLQRQRAEAVAEALIRLGLSFVLIPDTVIDAGDEAALGRIIRPLLGTL